MQTKLEGLRVELKRPQGKPCWAGEADPSSKRHSGSSPYRALCPPIPHPTLVLYSTEALCPPGSGQFLGYRNGSVLKVTGGGRS